MIREPLDNYDKKPSEMISYLKYNGWHFNDKLCKWAVDNMRKLSTQGKLVKIDSWDKEKVDTLLTKYGITLENNIGHDYLYVANMAVADFYEKSLSTEQNVVQFVKDVIDDADQNDGFVLNRFYADCVRNGIPIPWYDMI